MTQTQERALATTSPQVMTMPETNWDEVRSIFAGMVDKNRDDNMVTAALMVCRQFGFNPILKHIFLIKGDVYVSHKGLLNLAHRSGVFNGIEVLEQSETQTHFVARVAVYRKDMDRPFIYTGRYSKSGTQKQYGPEMAVTRAECMALRRAFDASLPVYEEINWQESEPEGQPRGTVTARETPRARLAPSVDEAAEAGRGLSHKDFGDLLASLQQMDADGVATEAIVEFADAQWETLDAAQQERVLADLRQIKRARKAAAANRAAPPAAPIEAEVVAAVPARTVQVEGDGWEDVVGAPAMTEVEHFGWTEFWS